MIEADSEQLKLMVVDDEADNLDLLYRTFRRDFQVFKAESGFKALQILDQEGEMAVIISDQRMPRMNGTEFLSRTVERFPDTIRILLTGYTDVEDLVGAINTGKVFKYITKPWNPRDLKMTVMQAADTYCVVKRRTNELHRALRRESIFNAVTTAIRGSLDYRSILQAVVCTIGKTFAADRGWLRSVETLELASGPKVGQVGPVCLAAETFCYGASGETASELAGASEQPDAQPEACCSLLQPYPEAEPDPTLLAAALQMGRPQTCLATEQMPQFQLLVPLIYQQELLAVLLLQKQGLAVAWPEEEVGLIEGVAEQAALAISQARLYQRIQRQTEQMQAELDVARQIQTYLLRQTLPVLDSVKIQAHCFPARQVGGDFFEIYPHPQGDIWLAVGDVSGKGVPAALFMASALSLLRRELAQEVSPEPDLVMRNLNHSLFENLVDSNCFITLVLIRYNPTTGHLCYANAGHIYPMVWPTLACSTAAADPTSAASGSLLEPEATLPNYLKVRGVPLGILPTWRASAGQLVLHSGDALLLTSDGITEATLLEPVAGRTMLHQSGLWQLITQQPQPLDLKELIVKIQTQTQLQEDDQTILSLEVL
jgi:serine phosphatase RsbU (regulator of sigma subunit)/FixJ family two-component response regulator